MAVAGTLQKSGPQVHNFRRVRRTRGGGVSRLWSDTSVRAPPPVGTMTCMYLRIRSFKNVMAHNNLAWLLATCPDNSLRDGNKAVELAQQAR